MSNTLKKCLLTGTSTLLLIAGLSTAPYAQDRDGSAGGSGGGFGGPPKLDGWQVDVGIGSLITPEYMGASSYRFMPIPYIDVKYKDILFMNVPKGIGGYIIDTGDRDFSLKIGGAVAPNFMNRDAEDFVGLPEIGLEFEARSYVEMKMGDFSLDFTLAKGLGNGHGGFYGDISVGWSQRVGDSFLKLSASTRIAANDYMRSFYSVRPVDTIPSGLSAYRADGGIESASVSALYAYKISEKWRASVILSGNHLLGNAADSPIVENRTSVTAISALTYRF